MSYTRSLASYTSKLKYEDLPESVIEQVKQLTLHVVGVSLAACQTHQGKKAVKLAKEMGGQKNESTIFGDGSKVSCVQAGFANGSLADILDWEDCAWSGHPSAGSIPAGLAFGERLHCSGKDYITSIVAGYEVYQRIAMAVQPSLEFRLKAGSGLTSWQIFAAALPPAKLLNFDEDRMAQLIGIAGAMTPIVNGKINISRSDVYHFQHGLTCRDGMVAAMITESGFNSLYDMLDGETGYWVTVADSCNWDWMTKGLGEDFLILQTQFKRWPVNMWVQQYLDLMDALINEEKFKAEDVAEIIISPSTGYSDRNTRMYQRAEGYSMTDAEFSIPYCLAVIMYDPTPGPNWYTDEMLKDPRVIKLAGKVRATGKEVVTWERFKLFQEGDYVEAGVEVVLNNGKRWTKSIKFPKGHPKNRFTYDEYTAAFRNAASNSLKASKIEKVIQTVARLEKLDDVSALCALTHN